jgi:hypothetical protein
MNFKQGVLVNKHARHNEIPEEKDQSEFPSSEGEVLSKGHHAICI